MKVFGKMISSMDKELKHGEILKKSKPLLLECSIKERRMVKEDFNGKMDHIMKAIS
jgi:hypothetical protein